jgi:hypothetical protein
VLLQYRLNTYAQSLQDYLRFQLQSELKFIPFASSLPGLSNGLFFVDMRDGSDVRTAHCTTARRTPARLCCADLFCPVCCADARLCGSFVGQ